MLRAQIQEALEAARDQSRHTEFVIAGSLSVLGLIEDPPAMMAMSIDIDFFPLRDPARASLIAGVLGEGSSFHQRHGYYLDAISPELPTLPQNWRDRLVELKLGSVTALFLDVNDAAVSKYARGADNDYRWIEAGIDARILDLHVIRPRMERATNFYDDDEKRRALGGLRLHQVALGPDEALSRSLLDAVCEHAPALAHLKPLNTDDGRYLGPLLWTDARHAIQDIGRDAFVIHRVNDWPSKPLTGQKVAVCYQDGRAEWQERTP